MLPLSPHSHAIEYQEVDLEGDHKHPGIKRRGSPIRVDEFGLDDDQDRFFNDDEEADITSLDENVERTIKLVRQFTGGRCLHKTITEQASVLGFGRCKSRYDQAALLQQLKTVDPEVGMNWDQDTQLLMVTLNTSAIAVYRLSTRELLCNRATLWLALYALGLLLMMW